MTSRKARDLCLQFGLRIKEARVRRRFTLAEVAQKIGVSERTYKRIEKGEGSVGLIHFIRAAELLDLDFFKDWQDILVSTKKRVRKKAKIESNEVDF